MAYMVGILVGIILASAWCTHCENIERRRRNG